jgi:HK97 family phage prohead protease
MQHRSLSLEFKLAGGNEAAEMSFSGYGAVFGNVDAYGDVIQPGAFADTLATAHRSGQYPAMLLQHGGWGLDAESLTPIGIWTGLAEDGHGLKVDGKLADTPRGCEVYALMKMQPRSAITGLSIGYIAKEWSARSKPEEPRRTLKKVELMEVSLVTFPANFLARVTSVKNGLDIRMAERALRDVGFSLQQAKAILAEDYDVLSQHCEEGEEWNELTALMHKNTQFIPTR